MKLNLKLLSTRFSQMEDQPCVPDDGVNRYLVEQVLRPNLEGNLLHLGDIGFDAFDADDVSALEEYYDRLYKASEKLAQFAQTVARVPPAPKDARAFCRGAAMEDLSCYQRRYFIPGVSEGDDESEDQQLREAGQHQLRQDGRRVPSGESSAGQWHRRDRLLPQSGGAV